MKIVWLLPFINLTGGVKVVFEYAERLHKRGHEVTVVYPGLLDLKRALSMGGVERRLRQLKYRLFVDGLDLHEGRWFRERHFRLKRTPTLEARYHLPADVTIATSFETAEYLELYPDSVGKKFYFVQGYETWVAPKARVDRTLRSRRLHKIVVSSYLKGVIRKLGGESYGPVLHGIEADVFARRPLLHSGSERSPHSQSVPAAPVVLMQYHELAVKGLEDGLGAVEEVRASGGEFRLQMFGQFPLPKDLRSTVERYTRNPKQAEVPGLYRGADIFLFSSRNEGFGLPVLEAMAAGKAIVTTRTGAVPDLGRDGVHFLVVPPEKPELLAQALSRLIDQPELRKRLGERAARRAGQLTWSRAVKSLERIFEGKGRMR